MTMISRRLIRIVSLFIVLIGVGLGGFYLGLHTAPSTKLPKSVHVKENTTIHHSHPNKRTAIHVPYQEADACPILMDCFSGGDSIYKDHETCVKNMDALLRYYHNSALHYQGRVIGFISFYLEAAPPSKSISIYNVCVHPDYRGMGLATRMIREGLDELVKHEKLDTKNLLIGLDVDLTTPMAAESFALYAKLGYIRAWQPCKHVGDVDWRPVIQYPSSPMAQTPLNQLLATPEKYKKEELLAEKVGPRLRSRGGSNSNDTNQRHDHFCMFRYYEESWLSMGAFLAEPFQPKPDQSAKDTDL